VFSHIKLALFLTTCILILGIAPTASAAVPSENLLPGTTRGFIAIGDVKDLVDRFNGTQLGKLMQDPVMKPFEKDLRRQLEQRFSSVRERLGLTLDDLRGVPSGEVALALIEPAPNQSAMALVVDVTGNQDKARELLVKVSATLAKEGAKETKRVVNGITVLTFDLPKPEDNPKAAARKAIYFLTENLLGASDNEKITMEILDRSVNGAVNGVADNAAKSLSNNEGFKFIMRRCFQDAGEEKPQIRWFIHPLGYAAAIRAATPEDERRKGKSVLEVLNNQGLAAIRGVGGLVSVGPEGYELLHRTAIFAPPPYKKAMKMVKFPNGPQFAPQRWVPRDIATYSTFYTDPLNAFDNFGSLFDELVGGTEFIFNAPLKYERDLVAGKLSAAFIKEFSAKRAILSGKIAITTRMPGSLWEIKDAKETYTARKKDGALKVSLEYTGLWAEVIKSLKEDPDGPKIDLRGDLMVHLGQRITIVTDYKLPVTPTSERLLVAIETNNSETVTKTVAKAMQNDPAVVRREVDGHIIWEMVPEVDELPGISVGGIPGTDDEEEGFDDEEEDNLLPHRVVTVAHNHLFIASNMDFLLEVLKVAPQRQTLGGCVDYRVIDMTIKQMGITKMCAQMFSRTDEEYRPTYELIRQGKMPKSETLLGRLLNAMFGTGKKGVDRAQQIDGSKLPDFQHVRRYLGPAGLVVTAEENGWFFKGFTLSKESP
jgi:hypothetical protein